jgi:hypothetical protein
MRLDTIFNPFCNTSMTVAERQQKQPPMQASWVWPGQFKGGVQFKREQMQKTNLESARMFGDPLWTRRQKLIAESASNF